MTEPDPSVQRPWWRSIHVMAMVAVLASAAPITAVVRGVFAHREGRLEREHEARLEQQRSAELLQQNYLEGVGDPLARARVLRLIAATSPQEGVRTWATSEIVVVEADLSRAALARSRQDTLQMEAFNLAAKALAKNPEALAEHYRQLGYAIAEGRVASSGVIESVSGTSTLPRLSDLIHKLIDEKEACVAGGKDDAACREEVGVVAEPTLADFGAMRDLEEKSHEPDARRLLSELRKRFLKD